MTERPGLDLEIFIPQVVTAVDIYREALDPDKKSTILNERVVEKTDEGVATTGTIRDLIVLAQPQGVVQYRPDAIVGLTSPNLVAVARGLIYPADDDLFLEAVKKIQQAAGVDQGEDSIVEAERDLSNHVFGELIERINNHAVSALDRRQLIESLGTLSPVEVEDMLKINPDLKEALVINIQEIGNEDVRDAVFGKVSLDAGTTLIDVVEELKSDEAEEDDDNAYGGGEPEIISLDEGEDDEEEDEEDEDE